MLGDELRRGLSEKIQTRAGIPKLKLGNEKITHVKLYHFGFTNAGRLAIRRGGAS